MSKVKVVSIHAENRPGVLARICTELSRRRNNLLGIYAPESDEDSTVKVLAADPDGARWQLAKLGYDCYLEEALSVELDNTPGSFAKVCNKLAKAGVNVRYAFATVLPRSRKAVIVIAVSDLESAATALRR